MDKNGDGNEHRVRNIILGVLGGAFGIIAIKLLFKWINGEI